MCLKIYFTEKKQTNENITTAKIVTKLKDNDNSFSTYFQGKKIVTNQTYINAEWNKLCAHISNIQNKNTSNEFAENIEPSISNGAYYSYCNVSDAIQTLTKYYNINNRFKARKITKKYNVGILQTILPPNTNFFYGKTNDNLNAIASEKIIYQKFPLSNQKSILKNISKQTNLNKHIIKKLLLWDNNN